MGIWETIFGDANVKYIKSLQPLVDKINSLEADFEKSQEKHLKERVARLKNKVAILNVGGLTRSEVEEKKYRVEDAIESTRAALEDGIVTGGEVALITASYPLPKDSIVYQACREPFKVLLRNIDKNPEKYIDNIGGNVGFDAREEVICNLFEKGIIDPVKVPIAALSNAVSVAINFLRSQAIVYNLRDVNKPIEDSLEV